MTRIRKLGALALATPLAMGFTILGAPLPAHAAAAGITSPASGAVITRGPSVTVSAVAPFLGGTLYVFPPVGASIRVASGGNGAKLSGKVPIPRNGTYRIELQGIGGSNRNFSVRVPPAAPGGLTATVSGKKLTARWNLGLEDDLTGYTVTALGRSHSVGISCPGSICSTSFALASNASGSVKVSVRARRSNGAGGTVTSATSQTSANAGAGGSGGGSTPSIPNYSYPNGANTPLTPVNPNAGLNLPTVAPDGSTPGFVYPTPPPEVATQNQVSPKAKPVAEVDRMAWGRSLALALILLVCAAHLGTWTRRLRFAQAGSGAGGRLGRRAGGKARVKTAHERIAQAEALAKTGTLSKADILGKAAAGRQSKAAAAGKAGDKRPKGRAKSRSENKSTARTASGPGAPAAAVTTVAKPETRSRRKTRSQNGSIDGATAETAAASRAEAEIDGETDARAESSTSSTWADSDTSSTWADSGTSSAWADRDVPSTWADSGTTTSAETETQVGIGTEAWVESGTAGSAEAGTAKAAETEAAHGAGAGSEQWSGDAGRTPSGDPQVEEAMAVLTGLATRTDVRTSPLSGTPTIAESASRSVKAAVPPIQPLDRPASATTAAGEGNEDRPATSAKKDDRKSAKRTLRGRRRQR